MLPQLCQSPSCRNSLRRRREVPCGKLGRSGGWERCRRTFQRVLLAVAVGAELAPTSQRRPP
jgi:hypothetical protein